MVGARVTLGMPPRVELAPTDAGWRVRVSETAEVAACEAGGCVTRSRSAVPPAGRAHQAGSVPRGRVHGRGWFVVLQRERHLQGFSSESSLTREVPFFMHGFPPEG